MMITMVSDYLNLFISVEFLMHKWAILIFTVVLCLKHYSIQFQNAFLVV